MRSFSQTIRDEVWARLRQIYMQFTNGNHNITIPQVEQFVVEVLGEKNRDEIGYVTTNIGRLDQDGNGFIQFEQFANFLLKQHCGEIALQKMHRNGKILNQNVYKINFEEFNILLNNAYEFLGVHPDPKQTSLLFAQADTDQDGLITYGEYFQFVEKFICRPKITITQRKQMTAVQRVEFNSRFRRFLWQELSRIFSMYDINRNRHLDPMQCRRMLMDLFPSAPESQIEIILRGIFSAGKAQLTFDQFVRMFIINVFDRSIFWHFGTKTHLSREQFIALIRQTLGFADINRVQDILLWRLYDRIDTDGDGLISLGEYKRWFSEFLAALNYYGSEYITQDDDYNLSLGNDYILLHSPQPIFAGASSRTIIAPIMAINSSTNITTNIITTQEVVMKRQVTTSGGINFNPFNFSSQQLALRVRGHLLRLLMKFDTNNNRNFQEEQIIQILVILMKEDRNEILYVIANVYRYDRNMDRRVTYDQLADFFLESHCGQLAIQRLHKKEVYQRGAQKMMNEDEFIYTLNYALSFIQIQASPQELSILFREIDRDRDGWISYREYFQFLKYYFGSKSFAAIETTIERIETVPWVDMVPTIVNQFQVILLDDNLSLEERLRRMLRLHLSNTLDSFDFDGNRVLTSNEIITLLQLVFGYNPQQIGYVMDILKRNQVLKRNQFVDLILSIHFMEFGFMDNLKMDRMSQTHFGRTLGLLTSFLSVKLSPDQLHILFRDLDTVGGGYITITQWEQFITRMFGRHSYRTNINVNQGFYHQVWGEFRKIFNLYDVGNKGYLSQSQLQQFMREVLLECQHKHRNTIMSDLQRLGPVNFDRFATFILGRCAQNALHRFHLQQPPGKDRLSESEFILLVKSAYQFLKSISQHTEPIRGEYSSLTRKHPGGVDYKAFIDWAYYQVARKVR